MNRKATDGKELEQYYAKNGNQLIVLYGRKDCKKEELLRSFVQDKKCFYYRCRQTSPEDQKTDDGRRSFRTVRCASG